MDQYSYTIRPSVVVSCIQGSSLSLYSRENEHFVDFYSNSMFLVTIRHSGNDKAENVFIKCCAAC